MLVLSWTWRIGIFLQCTWILKQFSPTNTVYEKCRSHYSVPGFCFYWGIRKSSLLSEPQGQSSDYTFIYLPNGTCFPQRLSARQPFRLIKFIFWLLFLSLISQSDTLHWKVKGEEIGEVRWFTVLLDFWLETKMSCGLTCKITHLSPLNVSDLNLRIIYPNSVRLCDCSYRAFRGR